MNVKVRKSVTVDTTVLPNLRWQIRCIIKFCLLLLCFIQLQPQKAGAQPMLYQADSELRALFIPLFNPHPNVKFLYDMKAHIVDSSYFGKMVYDTSNAAQWYRIYEEMYYSAYDTTQFISADSVYSLAYPQLQSDTIGIGIIDWDYNLLKPDALTTGNYFTFDTINTILYDIPSRPSEPYTIQTCFAGSPMRMDCANLDPVFKIDPQFIFKDSLKVYGSGDLYLRINFDDGTGWHSFTSTSIQYYRAVYTTAGVKNIEFAIHAPNNAMLKYAIAAFSAGRTRNGLANAKLYEEYKPDSVLVLPGMTASFYGLTSLGGSDSAAAGCQASADPKFVIYVEGFDFLNNRHSRQIYGDMISDPRLSELKNFGYVFVVVDWTDSHQPVDVNAMHLVHLLEKIKCSQVAATSTPGSNIRRPPTPFVIIGESMGGVVSRYALCYMESPAYKASTAYACDKEYMHNTRLLMTLDAPHDGANVPLGLQCLYNSLTKLFWPVSPFIKGGLVRSALTLTSGSADQLLLYAEKTDNWPFLPVSSSTYTESPARTTFKANLAALGNYPQYCKLVALSNGSWQGTNQERFYTGVQRMHNDHILDLSAEIHVRVLGIRIVGSSTSLDMRTNPQGTGRIFYADHAMHRWRLRLRLFGIRIVYQPTVTASIDKTAMNVRPYCVSAGGYPISRGTGALSPQFESFNAFDIFGFQQYSTGLGNYSLTAYAGSPFFGQLNFSLSVSTDGASFNFIPVQSSFDYNPAPGQDLNYNLLNDPVSVIMGRTPFDVVVTNPNIDNNHHLVEKTTTLDVCETCEQLTINDDIRSYLLNREIGDDTLWLENRTAAVAETIECERDLFANHRNIYYNYPSGNSAINKYDPTTYDQWDPDHSAVVYSKEDDYKVGAPLPAGSVPTEFKSNDNFFINTSSPLTGSYQYTTGSMTICCISYMKPGRTTQVNAAPIVSKASFLEAYPNPNSGGQLTLKYRMQKSGSVTITLFDMLGRQIAQYKGTNADKAKTSYFTLDLGKLPITSGVYSVYLSNGDESQAARFSVTR